MSDKNTKTNDMVNDKVLDELASEFDIIYDHMLENADKHTSVPMTDAEIWESLIPPFQD